jgi:hypothetical protein
VVKTGQAQPTGEDDGQRSDEIRGESLTLIKACNFLAHGARHSILMALVIALSSRPSFN